MTTTIGSGIGASLGAAREGDWGEFTAPTHFFEFGSETLEWKPKRIVGECLAAGRIAQNDSTRVQVSQTVEGDLKVPMRYKGMGLLLGALMGTLDETPTSPGGGSSLQLHPMSPLGEDPSLTVQVGRPQVSDALVVPYSYVGVMIEKGVFEFEAEGYVQSTFTCDGKTFDVGENPYADPDYLLPNPVHSFATSSFKMGSFGSEAIVEGIRKATVTVERPLRKDAFYLNGTGTKDKQVQNGWATVTVDLESDYLDDDDFCRQFALDAAKSVILESVGPEIAPGIHYTFGVNIPRCRWESGPPMVSGANIIQPKLQLIGLLDGTHPLCTLKYLTV